MSARPSRDDPTAMRNQTALTESSGAVWLVIGGLVAIICCGTLGVLALRQAEPAVVGIALVIALYGAMLGTRFLVGHGRRRLRLT